MTRSNIVDALLVALGTVVIVLLTVDLDRANKERDQLRDELKTAQQQAETYRARAAVGLQLLNEASGVLADCGRRLNGPNPGFHPHRFQPGFHPRVAPPPPAVRLPPAIRMELQ